MDNPLKDSVQDAEKSKELFQDAIKEEAERLSKEEGEEVTPEDFDQETMVFNHMSDIVVQILNNQRVQECFVTISKSLGEEETKALVNLLTLICTNATAGSILFYDNLLREKLGSEYRLISDHINKLKAEVDGYSSATKVLRKKVDDMEKHLQIQQVKKDLGEES